MQVAFSAASAINYEMLKFIFASHWLSFVFAHFLPVLPSKIYTFFFIFIRFFLPRTNREKIGNQSTRRYFIHFSLVVFCAQLVARWFFVYFKRHLHRFSPFAFVCLFHSHYSFETSFFQLFFSHFACLRLSTSFIDGATRHSSMRSHNESSFFCTRRNHASHMTLCRTEKENDEENLNKWKSNRE